MNDLPVHILLVEDNPGDVRLIQEMLRDATQFPSRLQPVDRLTAGLACLERGGIDIVLLDLSLPDSSGFDTFMRVHAQTPRVPIVILSGMEDEGLAIQSVREGAQDYLVKGQVDSNLLMRAIRYAIERKKTEEALQVQAEQYATILKTTSDAFCLADGQGRLLDVNQAMCQMTGYYREELLRLSFLEIDVQNTEAELTPKMQRVARDGWARFETQIRVKGGGSVDVEVSTSYLAARGHFVSFIHDITERKRAEAALRQSERFLNNIVENIPDMIFVKDARELKFVRFNKAGEDLLGVSRNELYGKTDSETMPEYIAAQYAAGDWEVLRNKQLVDIPEEPIQTKYKGTRIIHTKKIPIMDEEGHPRYLLGISEDITQRKQTEHALEQREQRLRTILQTAHESFWLLDLGGQIVEINNASCAMLGYTREELLESNISDVEMAETQQQTATHIQLIKSHGMDRFETRLRRKDGQIIDTEISVNYLDQDGGRLVCFIRDITDRKRAETLIREQLATLTALYSGSQKLATKLDSLSLAQDVARTCVEEFGLSLAWVGRSLPDGRVELLTQYPAEIDYPRQILVRWDDTPLGNGPTGRAIRSRAPVVATNLQNDPHFSPWKTPAEQNGFNCSGTFPLTSRDKVLGALMLYSRQPGYFTPEKVDFFQSYALQAAAVLENARLFEEAESRLSQVQSLHRIDTAIVSNLDLSTTLDVILDQSETQLKSDAVDILLYEPGTHMLSYAAGRGFRTSLVRQMSVRLGQPYAGLAVVERRTIMGDPLRAMQEQDTNPAYCALVAREGFTTHVTTPLIARGQVVGVLDVFHRSLLDMHTEWLAFLETLAGQAAIAIDSANLFDSLQRSNAELELAYDATLEGWSRAMDLRDRETEGHTQRVTDITQRLARSIGISDPDMVNLRRGALLHDIGKIGVPDAVLLKPGPLTDEEWTVMRKHPQYAYNMLSPIRYLRRAIDIPFCHHEKWDGSGYPRGLREEQIPLAARIFAVVDVWDALTRDRPYRPAWSEDKARDYIRTQAGAHFDPQVVEAFFQLDLRRAQ